MTAVIFEDIPDLENATVKDLPEWVATLKSHQKLFIQKTVIINNAFVPLLFPPSQTHSNINITVEFWKAYLFLQKVVKSFNVTVHAYNVHWRTQIPIPNMRI